MKPFYNSEEKIKALRFHAAELIDTPFAAHAMCPGVGIDCVHVNAWCYLKTGLLASFEPPAYQLDEGQHASARESKLIKWLESCASFYRTDRTDLTHLMPGDTVCFDTGKSEFHVGLMLSDRQCVHVLALTRGRVITSDLEQEVYYRKRLRSVFRPICT